MAMTQEKMGRSMKKRGVMLDQRFAGGIRGQRIDLEMQEAFEPAARLRHFENAIGLRVELFAFSANPANTRQLRWVMVTPSVFSILSLEPEIT